MEPKIKLNEQEIDEALCELFKNKEKNIMIPRQAIGKHPWDILGIIFNILPIFYDKPKKETIVLTKEEIIKKFFIVKNNLEEVIKKINESQLFSIQVIKNNLYQITMQINNINKFLKEVNRLNCVIIKKDNSTYIEDKKLSFDATGLLKFLLDSEEVKSINTNFEFEKILINESLKRNGSIEKTEIYLEELKKNGYCHFFDIVDRKNIKKGIENQIIIISNSVIDKKEAKKYLNMNDEKIVTEDYLISEEE